MELCYKDTAPWNKQVCIDTTKITTVENSVGITLPKEVLAKLRVG